MAIRNYKLDGKSYVSRHLWKLRSRTAPSARFSEKEICLYVYWNSKDLPTETQWKDPILRSIWILKTEWTYEVAVRTTGSTEFVSMPVEGEKAALKLYREHVKKFPRSKEVNYGRPLMPDMDDEGTG